MSLSVILLVIALICFVVDAVGFNPSRLDLKSAGLALLTGSFLA
jgi:hypothetical protein